MQIDQLALALAVPGALAAIGLEASGAQIGLSFTAGLLAAPWLSAHLHDD